MAMATLSRKELLFWKVMFKPRLRSGLACFGGSY
jgi:hypothetical protein